MMTMMWGCYDSHLDNDNDKAVNGNTEKDGPPDEDNDLNATDTDTNSADNEENIDSPEECSVESCSCNNHEDLAVNVCASIEEDFNGVHPSLEDFVSVIEKSKVLEDKAQIVSTI